MSVLDKKVEKRISNKSKLIREKTIEMFQEVELTVKKSKVVGDDGDDLFKATHEKTGLSSFGITPGEARENLKKLLIEESLSGAEIN